MNEQMNQEQKRVKIAEALGWRIGINYKGEAWTNAPDYFGDANAALALCDAMTAEHFEIQFNRYTSVAWGVVFRRASNLGEAYYGGAPTLPAAICEAFGRAKGLW